MGFALANHDAQVTASTRPAQLPIAPPWAPTQTPILDFPDDLGRRRRSNARPSGWRTAKKLVAGDVDLTRALALQEQLADRYPCIDARHLFSELVGSNELASHPVHRWYSYKEAFSPRLPLEIVERLGTGSSGTVLDPFGGVGTSALALQHHPEVSRVIGVEYSPFAHFVGQAKLQWPKVNPSRFRNAIARLRHYSLNTEASVPELAAFSNEEIFRPAVVMHLASARDAIAADQSITNAERQVLLLGLAAVVEDVSGAAKDGRALRILRDRKRKRKALRPARGAVEGHGVREVLTNQWLAMAEDLEVMAPFRAAARSREDLHLRGDARELVRAGGLRRRPHPLEPGSAGLVLYSPPYLNCIDYTEVYKLELWLLGFVTDHDAFKKVRLGTLRSHPSVRFPSRGYMDSVSGTAADAVELISRLLDERLPRPGLGEMAQNYFDDMYRVLQEQWAVLEPGGHSVCVVANSTFARREKRDGATTEQWRLPILTDVLIAALATEAGFEDVEVWDARDLIARNVRSGAARESLVVMRKPE